MSHPLLFCGNSNPQLAEEIAKRLRLHVGKALVSEFRNEETRVEIGENVRGSEVFVVQSICKAPNGKGVNDAVMELLLMIDALRRASAARITAIIPYYGYAKQDKKTKGREPISAKVIANLLKVTGARRIVTMDLHAAQIQGFFDIPVDNLMAMPVLCNYLKKEGLCDDKIVIVSPDAGGVHRAELFAKRLDSSLAIVFKRRPEPDVAEVTDIVGDVTGKVAVVVDDMISTGGTLAKAAGAIKARGATKVYTVASHGIFAGEAVEVLEESEIEKVLFTNTIPVRGRREPPEVRPAFDRADFRRRDQPHHDQSFRLRTLRRRRDAQRRDPPGRRGGRGGLRKEAVATKESILPVESRTRLGTGGANALRAAGKIPAVVYGHGAVPEHIAFDAHAFEELLHQGGRNTIITLADGGKKRQTALIREIQLDPVSRRVVHADLQRVSADESINARLPIVATGVAEGVRNAGAVMDVITHELEIEGPASLIPEQLEIDVTPLGIHEHLTAGDVALPSGFKLLTPPETIIVTIEASRTAHELEEAVTAPEEAAEPQIIGAEAPTATEES